MRPAGSTSVAYELLLRFVVVGLVVLAYGSTVKSDMLWDDTVMVSENAVMRMPDGLPRIWRGQDVVDYFPLTYSLFWLQYRAFGTWAGGYHAVNVALHTVAVLALLQVLRRLRVPAADLCALVFALHPVVGTSVEWISEQKNTLSLVFYAWSTLAFLRLFDASPGRRSFGWWLASLAAFALALTAKPSGVGLSIFFGLVALAWGWDRRRIVVVLMPYLLLCLLFGIATIWYQRDLSIMTLELPHDSWAVRVAVVGWNVMFYARMLLVPVRQSMVYPFHTPDVARLSAWLPDVALVAFIAALWSLRRRTGPLPLLGVAYSLLMLAPVFGFVPIAYMRYSRVADHLAYLGAIGILGLYTAALQAVALRVAPPAARGVGLLLLVGMLVWLDQSRCAALADKEACWRDVVAKYPEVWVGHANLGSELIRKGRHAEAVPVLEEQRRLEPNDSGGAYNLGVALMGLDRRDPAIHAFQDAIALEPANVLAHNNLGLMWLRVNALEEACHELTLAVRIMPTDAVFQNNLGRVLFELGRYREAEKHLKAALQIAPGTAKAVETLAFLYLRTDRKQEALDQAIALTQVAPNDARAWWLQGLLLLDGGNREGARDALRHALAAPADQPAVINDLGLLAARLGDPAAALQQYRKAQQLDARYLLAVNNEAWLLATSTDPALRNGAAAADAMRRVWLLGPPDDPQLIDTEAAVLAERGDMGRACERAEKALKRARELGQDALAADVQRHLDSYRAGRAWRE